MRILHIFAVALAFGASSLSASAQQPVTLSQVVDRIVSQEQVEMQSLRQYSPLVETYIQNLRPNKRLGSVPESDKYFLGRADLAKGVELQPLTRGPGAKNKFLGGFANFFSTEFLPQGFLQMIYLDMYAFDRGHYKFDYLRREFLGEVRCLVFDVYPINKRDKGRFVGRIWVEDQDFHIVRFNGAYGGSSLISNYFDFDSWRTNAGKNQWLPSFIYSQQGDFQDPQTKRLNFKPFRAQTRLWGYDLGRNSEEQQLTKLLVEAPVLDQAESANDYSPFQAQRSWGRQAEDNVTDSMERLGLMAPYGEVDKVLETVVSNIAVSNDLDIQPEVRCRVLMLSTLESFTIGHTIVISRGLIDVLPDEASLAAILAHELAHVVLGHPMDSQYAFLNRVRFDERDTFRHFGFARTPEEEQSANQKAIELLRKSPYKDQSKAARLFLLALNAQAKDIPNLISPHLGNRVPPIWTALSALFSAQSAKENAADETSPEDHLAQGKPANETPDANVIAALPLGGRIKIEPWNDRLQMLKSKPVTILAETEKMPFQVTPFVLYLTRIGDHSSLEAPAAEPPAAVSVKSDSGTNP